MAAKRYVVEMRQVKAIQRAMYSILYTHKKPIQFVTLARRDTRHSKKRRTNDHWCARTSRQNDLSFAALNALEQCLVILEFILCNLAKDLFPFFVAPPILL